MSIRRIWRLDERSSCIDHIWVVDEDTAITFGELMIDYLRHLKDHIVQIEDCIRG